MMLFLISTAFAGILMDEEMLQTECLEPGTCLMVVGEVIDAGCRSTSQDASGAIHRQFTATIEAIEGDGDIEAGDTFTLHTESSDYSNVDEDAGLPACTIYDPGHPIGEIARYYLEVGSSGETYSLYGSESFFHTDASDPAPEPLCAELEDWDPEGGDDSSDIDGTSASSDEKSSGCTSVINSASSALWLVGLMGLLFRARADE